MKDFKKPLRFLFSSTVTVAFFFSLNWLTTYMPRGYPHEILGLPVILINNEQFYRYAEAMTSDLRAGLFPIAAIMFAACTGLWLTLLLEIFNGPMPYQLAEHSVISLLLVFAAMIWVLLPSFFLVARDFFFAGVAGLVLGLLLIWIVAGIKGAGIMDGMFPGLIWVGSVCVSLWLLAYVGLGFQGKLDTNARYSSDQGNVDVTLHAATQIATEIVPILTQVAPTPTLSTKQGESPGTSHTSFSLLDFFIQLLRDEAFNGIAAFLAVAALGMQIWQMRSIGS